MSNVTFHFHLQVMYCSKGHSEILAIYIRSKVIVPCTFSTDDTSRQKSIQNASKQYAKCGSSMIFDRFVVKWQDQTHQFLSQYLMIPS